MELTFLNLRKAIIHQKHFTGLNLRIFSDKGDVSSSLQRQTKILKSSTYLRLGIGFNFPKLSIHTNSLIDLRQFRCLKSFEFISLYIENFGPDILYRIFSKGVKQWKKITNMNLDLSR